MTQPFGERLRSLRTRRRLTPSALAFAVGVTEGAIRQMESGQTKNASFLVGLRLSQVLGVSPWFLATGENAPPETESRSPAEPGPAALEALTLQVNGLERRVTALEAPRRRGKKRKAQG